MSAGTRIDRAGRDGAVFGAGHAEPYERILAGARTSRLVLQSVDGTHRPHSLEVGRWVRAATSADLTALEGATGPTLDVG